MDTAIDMDLGVILQWNERSARSKTSMKTHPNDSPSAVIFGGDRRRMAVCPSFACNVRLSTVSNKVLTSPTRMVIFPTGHRGRLRDLQMDRLGRMFQSARP